MPGQSVIHFLTGAALAPSDRRPSAWERVLASARAVLAVGFAIYCEPTSPSPYAALAYLVVLAYLVYSLLLLVFLRAKQDSSPAFRLSLHAVDTLWAALLCWFGGGPTSGLLFEDVFLIFVLLAAAYRWGLRETLATSSVCIGFLVAQKALAISGISQLADLRHFDIRHLYIKQLSVSDLNWLVMQALAMVVTAGLVGYVGEKENQLRANTSAIARVVGKTHSESGLRETMQAVLGAMLALFDSDRAVLATRQWASRRAFLWELERRRGREEITLQLSELESFQHERYFFPVPGQIFYAARQPLSQGDRRFQVLFEGSQTDRLVKTSYSFPDYFLTWHPFSSVLGGSVVLGEHEEWCGRLFLFDPRASSDRAGDLRFLHELIEEVGPAVYNVYRLRHLRSRAVSMERARIARELHDGVIQTLISTEMELAVLHRQATSDPAYTAYELGRIQNHLRQEILNVRDLIRRIKPIDLDGKQFLDYLAFIVDRFRRETGISARFVSDFAEVALPQPLAREVARIVQEALVNVRKHSHARSVLVRFAGQQGAWKLVIEDDGRGFEFSGRLSQAELDTARRGPLVLKERVRSIGGELAIESVPGHGARLEIALPQKA